MATFNRVELIKQLHQDVWETIGTAKEYKVLPDDMLNTPPHPGKWSIAQVLEHLNSYNRYYLPELKKSLANGGQTSNTQFKSGWFGNYFTKMMMPDKNGKVANKMQAPKDHRPVDFLDSEKVINEFIKGQEELLRLLEDAERKDIGKLKTPISITKFIKLKTGDTFRFLIAHQQRHMIQANSVRTALL